MALTKLYKVVNAAKQDKIYKVSVDRLVCETYLESTSDFADLMSTIDLTIVEYWTNASNKKIQALLKKYD
jgi:hypothetical protein